MIGIGIIASLDLFFYKHKNKLLFIASFFVFLFYAGFRDVSVGTDTENYSFHFDLVASGSLLNSEPLWYLTNKVVFLLGGNFQIMLVVSSFLTLAPVFYVLYKNFHIVIIYKSNVGQDISNKNKK